MFDPARLPKLLGLGLALALVGLLVGLGLHELLPADADAPALPRPDTRVGVGAAEAVAPVPRGFVGLSLEFEAAGAYTAGGADPVLEQLIRNLAPGGRPVLRIGGESTDHSWWPTGGVRRSPGLSYPLGRWWTRGVGTLLHDLHARVILGINLEAGSRRLAGVEARRLLAQLGRRYVESLELGNEPNLYAILPWWKHASGAWVRGRAPGYDPAAYANDLARFARVLPRVPLAGPALGSLSWMQWLPDYVRALPRIRDITFHRYPLNRCFTRPGEATYPTLANLLSPVASEGLAASIAPFAHFARAHGMRFRVDEMNSVACSGERGISDTYATALWVADALFAMAAEGVSGVNLHTFPNARYRLFDLERSGGRWTATVAPEYYGALLFVRAAPAGSRLLRISFKGSDVVRAWATLGGHPRATRVLLINDSARRRHVVQLRVAQPNAQASVQRLAGPGLTATSGVTLAGQAYAPGTTTARLAGVAQSEPAVAAGGGYRVIVPPASAALVTIPTSG